MAPTDPPFESVLNSALRHSLTFLNSLDKRSVAPTKTASELRQALAKPLPDAGIAAEEVIQDLARDTDGGLMGSASGRFFGWVIGGTLPAALAADWLTATWDQNASLYACAPAAAIVEEVAGEWLKDLLQLPAHASFALVSGSQMAHVTCLAAARHALLSRIGWDVEEKGLGGAPRVRILTSADRHGSIDRAVRLLGFGSDSLAGVATDSEGRVLAADLEKTLQSAPSIPAIICLQAGDICTGAFDDFEQIIPLAKRYSAWVHVDGAFGLWAAASPKLRHLRAGVQRADSWVTDGHKWLNVPYDSGYAFIADTESHRAAMALQASYVTHSTYARDQMNWNPEWSRRARGFPTYAVLRQLGREGIANLIERCCDHASALVSGIGDQPGAHIVCQPTLNQGLVSFVSPHTGATEEDNDRHTDEVIAKIAAAGEAFFTGTTWRGRRAMRISVCNWRTTAEDVERAVKSVASVLGSSHN